MVDHEQTKAEEEAAALAAAAAKGAKPDPKAVAKAPLPAAKQPDAK